ncbi:hypothetical protein Salat_1268800 [Sesamum alatum]|uniref:Plastid-targeted protein 2 n=1 Tax=Sesamum alatum TaxID=300844 RepID=A0AAE1YGN5_9LAMI|nr:hypothetical protein Salat_1268800 [Sesamum alatum]
MATSSASCNFNFPRYSTPPTTLSFSPLHNSVTLKHRNQTHFQGNNNLGLQWSNNVSKRRFVVYSSSVPPEAPLPSESSSNSFINQILGVLMTMVVPFLSNKLGPFSIFKNKIESTVETVEQIVNVVEKVAEQVDKVTEDITDDLPEGKLKELLDFVEDMAEKTADTADSIGDIIDKVQETGEQIESFVDSLDDGEEDETPKIADVQKQTV